MERIRRVVWLALVVSALAAACSDGASSTDRTDAADAGDDAADLADDGGADADVEADGARDAALDVVDAADTTDDAADAVDDAADTGNDAAELDLDEADASVDADGDGVPDARDLCNGSDDTVDLNADAVPDCTQNLLPNGGFDGTVNPWRGADHEPSADANDMAASGSALLSFSEGGPFVPFLAHCLWVEPDDYELYAQIYVPSGQDTEADTRLLVQAFREPFCPIADGFIELLNQITETPTDAWTTVSGELTVSAARPYLAVYVVLEPAANDNVDGLVDNVLLVPGDADDGS